MSQQHPQTPSTRQLQPSQPSSTPHSRKKRNSKATGGTGRFQAKYALEYGVILISKKENDVISEFVRCQFCFMYGKEHGKSAEKTYKRKPAKTVHYFFPPYRPQNFRKHNENCHESRWSEYEGLSESEKKSYFFAEVPYANTIQAHFILNSKSVILSIDKNVVEILIGDMLLDYGEDDDEVANANERSMSLFKEKEDSSGYFVNVQNWMQYCLCAKYIGISLSFNQVVQTIVAAKEVTNDARLGTLNLSKVIAHARTLLAHSLQIIKDVLEGSWIYSVAFDGATYQQSSYFDVRVRVFVNGDIQNLHVLAIPMRERHTGVYLFQLFVNLFDFLNAHLRFRCMNATQVNTCFSFLLSCSMFLILIGGPS